VGEKKEMKGKNWDQIKSEKHIGDRVRWGEDESATPNANAGLGTWDQALAKDGGGDILGGIRGG